MSFRRGRREHFLHGFAFGDAFTECAVAALFGETGDREIAHAAQAIEERGEIKIRTYQDNRFACIDISDDGIGISSETQKRIFEPFFTTKDVGSGTGMGLTVAYNTIVTQHRGQLLVNSKEGKGTTFTAKIPL